MEKFILRKAEKSDSAEILKFIKELADFEKLLDKVEATVESIENTIFATNTNIFAVIAEVDNKPVAFMVYFLNYSTFVSKQGIYLEDLYVNPEYRGSGIGKEMLRYLAQEAIDKNYGRVEWSVLNWNPARKFYESLGAFPLEEWLIYRLTGDRIKDLAKS